MTTVYQPVQVDRTRQNYDPEVAGALPFTVSDTRHYAVRTDPVAISRSATTSTNSTIHTLGESVASIDSTGHPFHAKNEPVTPVYSNDEDIARTPISTLGHQDRNWHNYPTPKVSARSITAELERDYPASPNQLMYSERTTLKRDWDDGESEGNDLQLLGPRPFSYSPATDS